MEQPTSQHSLAKPLNETTTMVNNLQLHEKFTAISCWETPPEPNHHIPDPMPEKPKGEAPPPEMLKTTSIDRSLYPELTHSFSFLPRLPRSCFAQIKTWSY